MIKYKKRILIFNVEETWFTYKYSFWNIFTLNVFMHVKNAENKKILAHKNISHTIELDLEQDCKSILANFSSQTRNQIKKAEAEGTIFCFHNNTKDFTNFLNDFAIKKNTYITKEENLLALGNSLILTHAEFDGQILASQSYLVDKELGIVRALHSATKRLDLQFDYNLIGRANKYLTYKAIMHFKDMGYKVYDFGGYAKDTNNESLKGINFFKSRFGGRVVPCFNYYSYNYWLLKKLSKILGLSGKL